MKLLHIVLLLLLGIVLAEAGCGIRPAGSRVINGQNASPHAWPWQISLRRKRGHICGGTIIGPSWIVTASHCVDRIQDPKVYTIVAAWVLCNTKEEPKTCAHELWGTTGVQQTVQVSQIIKHPSYDSLKLINDIALLKLASPIKMNSKVVAACLTTSRPQPGKNCYITGWGATRGGHPGAAKTLQQAVLPIVSHDTCRKKYTSRINKDYHICAGEGRAGASGGCNGDSGGPLVCEEAGRWYLHGAVSFGKLHCPTEYYTVFSRVSNYVAWIRRTTGIGPGGGGVNPQPPPPPTQGTPPPTPPPSTAPTPPPPSTQAPINPPVACKDEWNLCQHYAHHCQASWYVKKHCRRTCKLC